VGRLSVSGGAEAPEVAPAGVSAAAGGGSSSAGGADADAADARGPRATPGPLQQSAATDSADDDDGNGGAFAEATAPPPPGLRPSASDGLGADVAAAAADGATPRAGGPPGKLYPPSERTKIAKSWNQLMRWSRKNWKAQRGAGGRAALDAVDKVVVFGGGSFGTAMAAALARQKPALDVVLLLRDPGLVDAINATHVNGRYLPDATLPLNVRASADPAEAIGGAQYALHAVPVQHSRAFLSSIKDLLPPSVPVISVSKGLEVGTGALMSDLIPDALGRKQPTAFLSGPSFAAEVMARAPTGLVAASRDKALKRTVQGLFASPYMRVNTSSDVVGVEVCGALKNVLAIAAGIVEGLDLGMNARAALVAQGCAEIRWLAEKMGAKPATVAGLSGLGDIMLTCYGSLSRNRSVGVRLGRGERLGDILASSSQVAEGVATAGVVVALASRYHVQLPVLTAVAQVLAGALSPEEAVAEIMGLPQVEER
jgi:glycerol-3-phosphate dehydrogenase (NAD+)